MDEEMRRKRKRTRRRKRRGRRKRNRKIQRQRTLCNMIPQVRTSTVIKV